MLGWPVTKVGKEQQWERTHSFGSYPAVLGHAFLPTTPEPRVTNNARATFIDIVHGAC